MMLAVGKHLKEKKPILWFSDRVRRKEKARKKNK
jgi:hypothetical protein